MCGDPILVTIKGKQFEVQDEPADYWGWVQEGKFDHEWEIYDKYLTPEHTFIDFGAWVGSHSIYASTIANRVYAFEPDPVAFAILEKNAQGHPIKIHQEAIAGHSGEVVIGSGFLGASTTRRNLAEGGGIGAAVAEHTVTVPCNTLRQFVGDTGNLFLKIDIEGMEEELLEDIDFFREKRPSLFIEFHPWWWKDESRTRRNFQQIADGYKTVLNPRSGLYFLEN